LLQATHELELADVHKGLTGAYQRMHALSARYSRTRSVPVGIVNVSFQILDPTALQKGFVRYTADSLLETVPGFADINPY
jgi:hypothetical protein